MGSGVKRVDDDIKHSAFRQRETWLAAAAIAALVLIVYGDVLLRFDDTVISAKQGDISLYFATFREFGFRELAAGNLVLWNPHVFSGSPFVGGFQSAMFYPPNLMYMALPLAFALNLDICLHAFLLGLFAYMWIRPKVSSMAPALFASALVMLSGPYALRALAGQLTMLSSLAYAPLLLLAIDRVFDAAAEKRSTLGPVLVGIAATSLAVVAGYPGTVFMLAITAAIYCGLRFIPASRRFHTLLPLTAIAVCPVGITLVQLWIGAETASESIRSGGGSYEFATTFSFPFENLVTLVAPSFFGDNIRFNYWGRWNYWDVTFFLGVAATIFTLTGAIWSRGLWRAIAIVLTTILLLISFGRYTMLYEWLYDYVPGFQSFRAPSKFLFFAALFIALLSALGLDALLERRWLARTGTAGIAWLLGLALLAGIGAIAWARSGDLDTSRWGKNLYRAESNAEHYIWWNVPTQDIVDTARLSQLTLAPPGVTALLLGSVLIVASRPRLTKVAGRRLVWAAMGLGVIELIVASRDFRDTFDLGALKRSQETEAAFAACSANERVLDIGRFDGRVRNYAVRVGGSAVWGYDPVILKRYGEFCSFAAGGLWSAETLLASTFIWGSDPFSDAINRGYVDPDAFGSSDGLKFLTLLRPRFVVRGPVPLEYRDFISYIAKGSGWGHEEPNWERERAEGEIVYELPQVLPEFFLATKYVVAPPTIESLEEMVTNQVDLQTTVWLNSEPEPVPTPMSLPAKFGVLDRSSDHFTILVETPVNAILVASHAYSKGWRVVPLPGSAQDHYSVMPAYHALLAIPLSAGAHQFRLEYAPVGYRYGRWISLACLLAYLGVVAYWIARRVRETSTVEPDVKDLAE